MADKKNISFYFFELFVVFAGVSFAFIFDRIYDNYQESKMETEYLISFQSDLESDLNSLDTLISMNEKNLINLESIIEKYDDAVSEERKLLQTQILAIMINQFTFDRQTSTYESLKYAGNLSIISNQKLRKDIVDLYLRYETITLVENVYNDFVSTYVYPIGLENLNMANGRMLKDLSGDQKFKNIVFTYFFLLKQLNEEYQLTRETNKKLTESIKFEID